MNKIELIERKKIIKNLKKRIRILINCCNTLRVLSNVYVYHINHGIVLDLSQLKGSWDIERRPSIDGDMIKFLNPKSFSLITENKKVLPISTLSDEDLSNIDTYFEMMIKL